jgi:hypothetical protein
MSHPKFILLLLVILVAPTGFSQETALENESKITGKFL